MAALTFLGPGSFAKCIRCGDMDVLEKGHEPSMGFRNEMLTEHIEYKVARENQEQRHYEKNGYKHQHYAKNDREEAQLIRPHTQNAR